MKRKIIFVMVVLMTVVIILAGCDNSSKKQNSNSSFTGFMSTKSNSELTIETARKNSFKIAFGKEHTVGLKSDGTVVAKGDNSCRQCDVENWKGIVAVATGDYHTLGLRSNGTVIVTGQNHNAQCEVWDWKDIVEIQADADFSIGLKSDGTVIACGSHDFYHLDELKDIKHIFLSTKYSSDVLIGIKSDGTLALAEEGRMEGIDQYLEDCLTWENISMVYNGGSFVVAVDTDGQFYSCGDTIFLELLGIEKNPEFKNIVNFYPIKNCTLGLQSDGTVVAYPSMDNLQDSRNRHYHYQDITDWNNVMAIYKQYDSATNKVLILLKSDGTIVSNSDEYDFSDWNLNAGEFVESSDTDSNAEFYRELDKPFNISEDDPDLKCSIEKDSDGTEKYAYISKYSGDHTNLILPSTYKGVPIYYIGGWYENAFHSGTPFYSNIHSVTIPDSVISVYNGAFSCKYLKEINWSKSGNLKKIGRNAFSGCQNIEELKIPDGVEYIGDCAFSGWKSLKIVKIPKSVTDIEFNAFVGDENLTDVFYQGNEEEWKKIQSQKEVTILKDANIHFNSKIN